MTTQANEQDTDSTADLEQEDPPDTEPATDGDAAEGEPSEPEADPAEADKFVVNLDPDEETEEDDEAPPEDPKAAHRWKELKAAEKRAKALEAELAEIKAKGSQQAAPPAVKKPGPRPTLKDVDADENALADAILKWNDEVKAYEAEQKKVADEQETVNAAYREKVKKVGHPRYKEYEKAVDTVLSPTQANILLRKTKDTAEIVVGLGQNPAQLAKLAAIKDPVDFAFALRDLEKGKLVKTKRSPSTAPESVVRGGSGLAPDETLKRLEAEAERTKDRTPIIRYKEKLKAQRK